MSTITLPNIRVSSDLTVKVRLKDGGVAIDWSTLSNIRALIYSDAQRAMAGRCAVSVDEEDATLLVCQYAANKPQYIGVNRIVISATYLGEMKTYDKPTLNFVRWTDDQAGQEITISDPDVDVEIEVEDISSSILQEAVDAAFSAAERAEDAAEAAEHMVDIHTGPEGKSAYQCAVEEGYTGTEEEWLASLKGDTGETPDITIGTVTTVEPGTPAAATMTGTPEAPVLNLTIPQGAVGATPNFTVGEVTTGQPGTQVIVTITGTAAAPVLNVTIPQGLQGNTGSSVDYPYELVNNLTTNDATKGLSAAQGKVLKDEIDQLDLKVDSLPRGKDYGFFTSSANLPQDATEEGFAYVGATEPYAIWQFDGTTWTDSGVTANAFSADPEDVKDAVDDYLDEHPTLSGTFSNTAKRALIALLEKVAYIDGNGQAYIDALNAALNDVPIEHIDAVFTQGDWKCYDGLYTLDDLKSRLVVTVYYVDGAVAVLSDDDYVLSGTLTAGTSTITATVDGQYTDTFTVVVTATLKVYMEGDECTALTGGWTTKGWNMTGGSPLVSKEADHLYIKFNSSASAARSFSATNTIDITGMTKLITVAEGYNAKGNGTLWMQYPATLNESTTQAGAFGDDYSNNRNGLMDFGAGGSYPEAGKKVTNILNINTARTNPYICLSLNVYSSPTAGCYTRIYKIMFAAE